MSDFEKLEQRCVDFLWFFLVRKVATLGQREKRWISRHRLERVDPNDPRSAIRNPIRYYIDPGIPEPMKQRPPSRRDLVQQKSFLSTALAAMGLQRLSPVFPWRN